MVYGMLKHEVAPGSREMHTYCIKFYKEFGVEFTNSEKDVTPIESHHDRQKKPAMLYCLTNTYKPKQNDDGSATTNGPWDLTRNTETLSVAMERFNRRGAKKAKHEEQKERSQHYRSQSQPTGGFRWDNPDEHWGGLYEALEVSRKEAKRIETEQWEQWQEHMQPNQARSASAGTKGKGTQSPKGGKGRGRSPERSDRKRPPDPNEKSERPAKAPHMTFAQPPPARTIWCAAPKAITSAVQYDQQGQSYEEKK